VTLRLMGRAVALGSLAPVLVVLAACTTERTTDGTAGDLRVLHDAPLVDNTGPRQTLSVIEVDPATSAVRLFPAGVLDQTIGDRVSVAAADGMFHVRSVREFSPGPVVRGSHVIERTDRNDDPLPGWGSVRGTDAGFLGELLNTGWVTGLADGGAAFAYALAPEVVRFDPHGAETWRSLRPAPAPFGPPVLVRDGSSVRPAFTEVQHAITLGPKGRLYVLAGATRDSMRVDVLDEDGRFVGTGWVPRGRDIMVDRDDRLVIGAASADESTGVGSAFVDFDLPGLDGDGKIRLSDYRGRVVVVNVWASWCAPCRLEMPALDSLAGEFAPKHVTILGLNDDEDPDAARRFVRSLGGVRYPLGAGMGALQERFDLRGLPYTVVLDRDHRIIEEISGFGGTLEPVRRAIAIALDTASGRNSP